MKKKQYLWTLLLCGLMAMALALTTTGCDDDDHHHDGPGADETAPDSDDNGEDGDTPPDVGPIDEAPEVGEGEDDDLDLDLPPVVLMAPTLVSPANDATVRSSTSGVKVKFRWNAVAGATGYVITIKATETPVTGTSYTKVFEVTPLGSWTTWKVRAVREETQGPTSDTWRLNIEPEGLGL